MPIQWSEQQEAIFEAVRAKKRHLLVVARAGSAKTTTIVRAANNLDGDEKVYMGAFSGPVALELDGRVLGFVTVRTLHSLGFRALRRAWGEGIELDRHRDRTLVRAVVPASAGQEAREDVEKLVRLAKAYVFDSDEDLAWLMSEYDCAPLADRFEMAKAYMDWTRDVLAMSRAPGPYVSYDDMVYVPAYHGLTAERYPRAMYDESQDLNRAQLIIAGNTLLTGGQSVYVGDDRQRVYSFRGADRFAMDHVRRTLDPQVLYLTTTYRCARKIVELARRYVPDFEAAPGAPEGVVARVSRREMVARWRHGDFVVSRTNAPLAELCVEALLTGKRAKILGRDLGEGLAALVRRSGAEDIPTLCGWVRAWGERERDRLVETGDASHARSTVDKANSLLRLAARQQSVAQLLDVIQSIFAPEDEAGAKAAKRITFLTAHAAKGLEAERVWLLDGTFRPKKSEDEANVYYVGISRAKRELYLVKLRPSAAELAAESDEWEETW